MTNQDLIYVKRLLQEIDKLMQNSARIQADTQQASGQLLMQSMDFFMGLSLALAMFFEEQTGKSAKNVKPRDVLEWARNLPQPQKRSRLMIVS